MENSLSTSSGSLSGIIVTDQAENNQSLHKTAFFEGLGENDNSSPTGYGTPVEKVEFLTVQCVTEHNLATALNSIMFDAFERTGKNFNSFDSGFSSDLMSESATQDGYSFQSPVDGSETVGADGTTFKPLEIIDYSDFYFGEDGDISSDCEDYNDSEEECDGSEVERCLIGSRETSIPDIMTFNTISLCPPEDFIPELEETWGARESPFNSISSFGVFALRDACDYDADSENGSVHLYD